MIVMRAESLGQPQRGAELLLLYKTVSALQLLPSFSHTTHKFLKQCVNIQIFLPQQQQDVMGLSAEYIQRPAAEETINDPTNPKHYWRYRMHVTVEDLCNDRRLLGDLQVPQHCCDRDCIDSTHRDVKRFRALMGLLWY